VISQFLKA